MCYPFGINLLLGMVLLLVRLIFMCVTASQITMLQIEMLTVTRNSNTNSYEGRYILERVATWSKFLWARVRAPK